MKKAIGLVLLAALLAGWSAAAFASDNKAAKVGPQENQLSPAIELSTFDDKPFTLKYSTRPLILIFGVSWSIPCQNELREMMKLYGENCDIVAVLFDKKQKEAKKFVAQNDFPFPVLLDKKLSLADKFQILILPTTFCVRNRMIEKIFVDYDGNTKKSIEEWLKY